MATGQRSFWLADESLVTYPIRQSRVKLMGQNLLGQGVFTSNGTMPPWDHQSRDSRIGGKPRLPKN